MTGRELSLLLMGFALSRLLGALFRQLHRWSLTRDTTVDVTLTVREATALCQAAKHGHWQVVRGRFGEELGPALHAAVMRIHSAVFRGDR